MYFLGTSDDRKKIERQKNASLEKVVWKSSGCDSSYKLNKNIFINDDLDKETCLTRLIIDFLVRNIEGSPS